MPAHRLPPGVQKANAKRYVAKTLARAQAFRLIQKGYSKKIVWANFCDVFHEGFIPNNYIIQPFLDKKLSKKTKRVVCVPSLETIRKRKDRIRKTWQQDDNRTVEERNS